MTISDGQAGQADVPCPKCRTMMVLACTTPHPVNPNMLRHTFLCSACNQTRTYALPRAAA
jgi:hypothetical protein